MWLQRLKRRLGASGVILLGMLVVEAQAADPTLGEVLRLVQQQQAQIDELRSQLLSQEQRLQEAAVRLQETSQLAQQSQANQQQIGETRAMLEATVESFAAADIGAQPAVRIGGYGELHYNNNDAGAEMDMHRFVLFFGHQFSDELSFVSELELEHSIAGDGQVGEIELEQAYVQWDYRPSQRLRMGMFLLPVGSLNETHEPNTFYGVERNNIERTIIPTTWWEAGLAFSGELAPGWGYDLAVHSGLNLNTGSAASPTSASRRTSLRSGRQKVGLANADSLAYTGRLSYSGMAGLQVSAAMQHQTDITQGDDEQYGIGPISANLLAADLNYQRGQLGFRALYATWLIDDEISRLNAGAERQTGWYVEPSYRLLPYLGVFARYGTYDLTAGQASTSNQQRQVDICLNYWLHDNVVLKVDLQRQDNDRGAELDGFNVGLGYNF